MSRENKPLLEDMTLVELNQEDSADLIELVSMDHEDEGDSDAGPTEVSVLPIKNTVLFPGVIIPITVGRKKSIRLVKQAYEGDRLIGVVAQKNNRVEEPDIRDVYKIGTLARILKMLVLPDGNTTIIIQGKQRYKIKEVVTKEPFLKAKIKYLRDKNVMEKDNQEDEALVQSLKDAATRILHLNPDIPQEAQIALDNITSPSF